MKKGQTQEGKTDMHTGTYIVKLGSNGVLYLIPPTQEPQCVYYIQHREGWLAWGGVLCK